MGGKTQRPIQVTEEKFDTKAYQPGSESIVATTKVPSSSVWQVPVGQPLVAAIVTKQTVSVAASTTASKSLTPEAPVVDYKPDVRKGEYSADGYLAAYIDADGNGDKDTLVTGSTETQFTGNFTEDGDFLSAAELKNTTASAQDVDIYSVVRHGYLKIQKRNSGKSNAAQELQNEDSIEWAFSNPDDPDSDRQLTWDGKNSGLRGIIPPKFNVDLVFYDASHDAEINVEDADNFEVSLPFTQRGVKQNEDPAKLRRKVTRAMLGGE